MGANHDRRQRPRLPFRRPRHRHSIMVPTIRRPTAARFSWELPMKHPPSPSPASASGGYRRAASLIRNPATIPILANRGGSNGAQRGAWKQEDSRRGLLRWLRFYASPFLTILPGPPNGTHRHSLFSRISRNWAAEPLDGFEKALQFIRTTTTATGLKMTAQWTPPITLPGSSPQKTNSTNSPFDRNVFHQNGTTPSRPKCEIVFGRLLRAPEGAYRA